MLDQKVSVFLPVNLSLSTTQMKDSAQGIKKIAWSSTSHLHDKPTWIIPKITLHETHTPNTPNDKTVKLLLWTLVS